MNRNSESSIRRLNCVKRRIEQKSLGLTQHVLDNLPERFDNNIHKLYQILLSCLGNIHYSKKRGVYMCANNEYYFVFNGNTIITAVKKDNKTY